MPNSVFIPKSQLSPKVILNAEENKFIISGKSVVENAHEFYEPIIKWFGEYFTNPNDNTEIVFYLEYLNSSSSLQIANLVNLFTENIEKTNLKITWIYDENDDLMEETGKEYQYAYHIKFNFIELSEEEPEDFNFEL